MIPSKEGQVNMKCVDLKTEPLSDDVFMCVDILAQILCVI
jgi:hypothetical protein